jgi:hypothetical protein
MSNNVLHPVKIANKRLRQTRFAAHKLAQSLRDLGMVDEQMKIVHFVQYLFGITPLPQDHTEEKEPIR